MFTPLRGLLFDPSLVSPTVADATSPPYDVIDDDERLALMEGSPHNMVRLLLPEGGDERYQRAAATLTGWREAGVLRPDTSPRFYIYEMDFLDPEGRTGTARGVLGTLVVEPLGDRIVGHEETMAKHRADRMALLEATEANLDVIVALSSAPDLAAAIEPIGTPRLSFGAGGVRHRLYDVADADRITAITDAVAGHGVAIADGHHRYTTALAYADGRDGSGPWDGILTFLAPAQGSGLYVAPYHRVFPSFRFDAGAVAAAFDIESAAPGPPHEPGDLVVAAGDSSWHLRAREATLADLPAPLRGASAAIARRLLYPPLGVDEDDAWYTPDAERAVAEAPPGGAALLVAPVSEEAIALAGEEGVRFPQKSTFFTPKPRAGLVIRTFDAE